MVAGVKKSKKGQTAIDCLGSACKFFLRDLRAEFFHFGKFCASCIKKQPLQKILLSSYQLHTM
jgi:hypothetical protein